MSIATVIGVDIANLRKVLEVRKTGIVYHEDYPKHDPGPWHPERPERLINTMRVLEERGVLAKPNVVVLKPEPATEEDLLRVHDKSYIDMIRRMSQSPGPYTMLTPDTPIPRGTYELAVLSAGGAILAGRAVAEGEVNNAFALIRPPGHHAGRDYGGGFCYFNNIAIMIEYLRQNHGYKRFMILDWDVHHGNGTQDIYYQDPSVLYFSTHQSPLYPGTGSIHEVGRGEGEGYTVNLPLPPGTSGANYQLIMDELFAPLAEEFKPDIFCVSAGQDAYFLDPIANLRFCIKTYAEIAQRLVDLAEKLCNGRISIVLEGGYNLQGVPHAITAVITTLAGLTDIEIIEPVNPPPQEISETVAKRIQDIKKILSRYWKIFA